MGQVLTAVLTHLGASRTEAQLTYLRSLAPGSRFVVCHGGKRADFDALGAADALFIDDPTLRGPHYEKSLNDTLGAIYESCVRDDAAVEFVYVIEYDHLILRPDFDRALVDLARRTNAAMLAKNATPRNDTNWSHFLEARDDGRLDDFIAGISRRGDPERRWGCLGTGILLRRDALEAFCSLSDAPARYVELFVPTVVYQLGFDVVNVDAAGDLYAQVRWRPPYSVEEVGEMKRRGVTFVHPFKDLDALDTVLEAPEARETAAQI